MQLLRSFEGSTDVVSSDWLILDDEAEIPAGARIALSYSRYLSQPGLWDASSDSWTIQFQPADELLDVPPAVLTRQEILVAFPLFTDGRGYSHAATLRQQYGFQGVLVAFGDVRRDQLEFMRETGFNAFQITGNDTVEDMIGSLSELHMPAHRLYSGARV